MRDEPGAVAKLKQWDDRWMARTRRPLTLLSMFSTLALAGCSPDGGDQAPRVVTTVAAPTLDARSGIASTAAPAQSGSTTVEATMAPSRSPAISTAENAAMPGEIARNPASYLGKLVTVEGIVKAVAGERAFTIAGAAAGETVEVLVIGADKAPLDPAITPGAMTRITGAVRELSVTEVERQFDFDLAPELEAAFANKAVILATSIEVIQ